MPRRLLTLFLIGAMLPAVVAAADAPKKVVLIAGPITGHPKHTHEYEKNVILLKHLLDTSPNVKGLRVEAHFRGWPENEATLDDADTIVLISDGGDRNEAAHPLYVGNRREVLAKQMAAGAGSSIITGRRFIPAVFMMRSPTGAGATSITKRVPRRTSGSRPSARGPAR